MDIDPECGVFYSLKSGVVLCRLISVLNPEENIPAPNDSTLAYKQVGDTRGRVGRWRASQNSQDFLGYSFV